LYNASSKTLTVSSVSGKMIRFFEHNIGLASAFIWRHVLKSAVLGRSVPMSAVRTKTSAGSPLAR